MAIEVGNFFPLLKEFKEQHPVKYVVENIDRAIEHKWIKVYYQPAIRSLTGALCGVESLMNFPAEKHRHSGEAETAIPGGWKT